MDWQCRCKTFFDGLKAVLYGGMMNFHDVNDLLERMEIREYTKRAHRRTEMAAFSCGKISRGFECSTMETKHMQQERETE